MNAYLYAAALYCGPCGETIRADLDRAGKRPPNRDNESSYDSDQYPKGPYSDGGGESDSPCHCDACGAFLENPLTDDGVEYVREQVAIGDGRPDILAAWRAFYSDELAQLGVGA